MQSIISRKILFLCSSVILLCLLTDSFRVMDSRKPFATRFFAHRCTVKAFKDEFNDRNTVRRNDINSKPESPRKKKLSIYSPDIVFNCNETSSNDSSRGGGRGRITMIGAGPGDPDLLTIRAMKILSDPEVLVIADRLVSADILNLIKGEIKTAKKHPGCAEIAQEEIYSWVEEGVNEGRHVIRLKIGDPFVFGRGGEEVLRFRSMGYEPVVIPGVSATFSAPLLGGIPVTHRGVSNQVVMCTGYGRNGTSPDLIQYHKEQTVVFLMAVGRLRELSSNLCTLAGYPCETPVGIIEKAGLPDQRTILGNLANIADLADRYQLKAPSTIVVGECVHVLLDKNVEGLVPKVNTFAAKDISLEGNTYIL